VPLALLNILQPPATKTKTISRIKQKRSQMLVPIAKAAAGFATVILSSASIYNMYEMQSIVDSQHTEQTSCSSLLNMLNDWKSINEATSKLKKMTRSELIELYLGCDAPGEEFQLKDGAWKCDGYLLENGPILSHVTNFITNILFGRGQRWLGKTYFPHREISGIGGIGKNRFMGDQPKYYTQNIQSNGIFPSRNNKTHTDDLLDRTFDYYIGPSNINPLKSSLINDYAPHCKQFTPMSLIWRGMVDELRVVPLPAVVSSDSNEKTTLLLGMGYFTWSGGSRNSAPFCLVARPCNDCEK